MRKEEFEAEAGRNGYSGFVQGSKEPNESKAEHCDHRDVALFVVAGELSVHVAGVSRTYRAGDSFAMPADTMHTEDAGPEGATYLAGFREAPPPR